MSNNFTWLFNWLLNSSAFFCTCLFIFEMGERQFLETVWSYPVLWLMQVSWIFHGASMQVSCWLHAGFANLAYWWVTSMTTPWNLHGICMEPPWNLHQAECMIKPTSVDRGITSITHMETAWNSTSILHGTCMEPPWKLHQLEGAMQPSRLDTRNNGTYMKPPWNLHQFSMEPAWILHQGRRHTIIRCRYREHVRVFLMETTWKPSDALMQIDRKSIVTKLIAQKLL